MPLNDQPRAADRGTATEGAGPDISVVICTLRRRTDLEKVLLSCMALADLDRYAVEIVVVDNSPEAEAKAFVAQYSGCGNVAVRYVHEPRLSIAYARNAGIAAAGSDLVAFIDDDMRLSTFWLRSVMRHMGNGGPNALICAITPLPEQSGQVTDPRSLWPYRRDLGLPEGHHVRIKPSGHIPGAGAGNSVLRRSACMAAALQFDPAFGNGGEDTDFFMRLGRHVTNIAWSVESLAYEIVSPGRMSPEFLSDRALRGSRNLARALIKNSRHPLLAKSRLLAIACVQGIWRASHYCILLLARPADARYAKVSVAAAFGKLPWRLAHGSWWAMTR